MTAIPVHAKVLLVSGRCSWVNIFRPPLVGGRAYWDYPVGYHP